MSEMWRAKRGMFRSGKRFFLIADLFDLKAKDWVKLLDSLDSLTLEERDAVMQGRDDEYGFYR